MNIRRANSILNAEEFRKRKIVLRSKPRYVMVELTQGCNLSCKMCRPSQISISSRQMSKQLFDNIAAQLFQTAEIVDLRGWGESLLLPDISDFVNRVADSGADIRFVTNLSFRRPEVIALLIDHHAYVSVSVDTADEVLLRYLRGGARLNMIKSNLKKLVAGYIRRWGSTGRLSICCTVQRPALATLCGVVELAAEVGISHIRLFGANVQSNSELSIDGHEKDVSKALKKVAETASELSIAVSAGTRLDKRMPLPLSPSRCLRYWSTATFSYDGMLGYCDHLIDPSTDQMRLGSVRGQGFDELWNGKRFQLLRTGKFKISDECKWCETNRYIDFEDCYESELSRQRIWIQRPNK